MTQPGFGKTSPAKHHHVNALQKASPLRLRLHLHFSSTSILQFTQKETLTRTNPPCNSQSIDSRNTSNKTLHLHESADANDPYQYKSNHAIIIANDHNLSREVYRNHISSFMWFASLWLSKGIYCAMIARISESMYDCTIHNTY